MPGAGERASKWGVRLRASCVAGAAALVLAAGCAADRPPPASGGQPAAPASPGLTPAPAVSPARLPRPGIAGLSPAPRRTQLPAPVAMPGGGVRIDMRTGGRHVRALERQPDGSLKQVCLDAPDSLAPGASR
jgi:hypothetical protein